ncbi:MULTISPECIES: response regulator transcription factor [Clostridium]|uniref:Stage 0 sporulation protein A homolog n=2 Tax=Clostridium TaxID=1485 RepID=D8GKL3_CLOLD|nr:MULTISPECIES: response regulator transcription factor [Clostridium]ADK15353.1 predicted two-component response regulator [Clostridium ljungdahlii DSM 13528]OAA88453.1 Response regulator ArlR [Clostridium ljungdahlii DSM 13528]RMD02199.1 DNA-binding response regulator [Clostridium autoethanogenum]
MAKILAVDDDKRILKLIKNALELNHHEVITLQDPENIPIEEFCGYDLILLDVMMPEIDGFELCQKIRSTVDSPIIFLTAKTDESSIVKGLAFGGDDYISKPFGVMELNARVEAYLRRENRGKSTKKLVYGDITIDFDKKEILVNNNVIAFTKNEYNICEFLALNRGKVFTKQAIFEAIYDLDSDTQFSVITEYIRLIRNKFKEYNCFPIETVWGVGYMWK